MKNQLEKYLGCEVQITKYDRKLSLPIFMAMRDINIVEIYGVNFAVVNVVKEPALTIAAMKKQKKKYEEILECPVVYEVSVSSISMRNALVKNDISFIDLPENMFIPFIGIVLQDIRRKKEIRIDKMMPATQMVFLELLYMDDDETVLKSEIAYKLNLTKTSITRATAQLKEMNLIVENKLGKEIFIRRNYPRREYYENAKDYLINPIQKSITIMRYETAFESFYAGETALSQLSDLNPPRIEEHAVYKGEEAIDQVEIVDVRHEEWENCLTLQLWKYNPSYFARNGHVDPISLICTFKENDDERIEMSIEELLEEI